jgi:ribosome biogenesis GTPase / thiamine phosphate phosphatase
MSRKSKVSKAQKAKTGSKKHNYKNHKMTTAERKDHRNRAALHLVEDRDILYALVVGRRGPVYLVEWTTPQTLIELELLDEDQIDAAHKVSDMYETEMGISYKIGDQIPCIAKGQGKSAVVGDWVQFVWEQSDLAQGLMVKAQSRMNTLVRLDALGRRPQTLAANLDRIWVVCAVEPPPKSGLIDRYLVAAHAQGIEAGLIFNKIDLIMDEEHVEEIEDLLMPYRTLQIPVILASASSIDGIDELHKALAGTRNVLVGHSGVGKTSLLNALIPGLREEVTALSEATGKGQHTTTSSTLYRLTHGGEIIDSPGIRSFGLWGIESQKLRSHFVEFLPWAGQCQFHNCSHTVEPKCAVIQAMDDDLISFERYDAYVRIYEDLLESENKI